MRVVTGAAWPLRLLVAAGSISACASALAAPTLTSIGAPANGGSAAVGISGDGHIVVGYTQVTLTGGFVQTEAFRWTSGTGIVGLGQLTGAPIPDSRAAATNGDGSVIVGTASSPTGFQAFRWTSDGMVGLGDFAGGVASSAGSGVSADGLTVVGTGFPSFSPQAFSWTTVGGVLVGLSPIDDPGNSCNGNGISANGQVIVGQSRTNNGFEACYWNLAGVPTSIGDLGGGVVNGSALACSADGSVIVGSGTTASGTEAFRWTQGGGMVSLGDLAGGDTLSTALAVSADGSVVVGRGKSAAGDRAFIWTQAGGLEDLATHLSVLGTDITGWTLTSANGISSDGTIVVGSAQEPGGAFVGFIANLTSVPCYANCDGSTGAPLLTAADFTCFLNKFRASDAYANCDGSTGSPALTAADFTCFLSAFRAGCP